MKKLFLISSVLFAMMLGFAGCQDLENDIAGTKWENSVSLFGIKTGMRIEFDKNGGFTIGDVTKVWGQDASSGYDYKGTYEYANGKGTLTYDYGYEFEYTEDFTVSGKKLTLGGVEYKKK